jgi:hypothetical protein
LDDTEAACTESAANGDLTLARGAAREEETSDVDAGDDPEECGGGEEGEEGAGRASGWTREVA